MKVLHRSHTQSNPSVPQNFVWRARTPFQILPLHSAGGISSCVTLYCVSFSVWANCYCYSQSNQLTEGSYRHLSTKPYLPLSAYSSDRKKPAVCRVQQRFSGGTSAPLDKAIWCSAGGEVGDGPWLSYGTFHPEPCWVAAAPHWGCIHSAEELEERSSALARAPPLGRMGFCREVESVRCNSRQSNCSDFSPCISKL